MEQQLSICDIIINQQYMEQEYSSQSSYSSEDQDAVLLTDKVESKLLTVVAKLRNKDPEIYNIDRPIFQENDFINQQPENTNQSHTNKKSKLTYGHMLAKGAQQQESSISEQSSENPAKDLRKIKEKFKEKLTSKKQQEKAESDDDQMFKVKKKLEIPKQDEKDKLKNYLAKIDENSSNLLKSLWDNPKKMDKTDLFLRNYILDKKWITSKYVGPNGEMIGLPPNQDMIDEEDEQRSVEMDEYEAKYNFRYEQPGADKITQYPREIPQSMRIKPETRKEKRKKTVERKRQQEARLRKEAQEMKQQKKRQILQKLEQGEEMKNEENDNNNEDFENDWFFCDDCAKALQQNEHHYVCDECGEYMLCQQCYDLIIHKHEMRSAVIPKGFGPPSQSVAEKALQQLKNCRNCRKKLPGYLNRYEYTDKTYMLNILCQKCYDESGLDIKKKFKLVEPAEQRNYEQILQKNPQKIKEITCQQDIEQLVDEYMKYDFEDVIGGGLKTKFRYVNVKPESYGLSDEQILYGDDKELNKYVSIKRLAAYEDEQMKLRNNLYKRKVVGINKTAQENRKLVNSAGAKVVRGIQKVKNRAQIMKKKRENMKKKLKIVNLTNPENQKRYLVSKSRLASYGLMQQ